MSDLKSGPATTTSAHREFERGSSVRFSAYPTLVCTVTNRRRDVVDGELRYELTGHEGRVLGWYEARDLEAV